MNHFTRREKLFVIIFGILNLLVFIFHEAITDEFEILWLLIIVLPLGYLIATDPERQNNI